MGSGILGRIVIVTSQDEAIEMTTETASHNRNKIRIQTEIDKFILIVGSGSVILEMEGGKLFKQSANTMPRSIVSNGGMMSFMSRKPLEWSDKKMSRYGTFFLDISHLALFEDQEDKKFSV